MFNSKLRVLAPLTLLIALLAVGTASANVNLAPYGSTSDPRPGAHGDLITGANFTYDSPANDDLKSVLIDLPFGGVGNPNAVPYADRCPLETFNTGTCPAASQIGEATVDATATVLGLPVPLNDLTGPISIIQTTPEVPTIVGAYITPPLGDPVRTIAKFYPVTSGPEGDFRIRTQIDEFPTQAKNVPVFGNLDITINRYQQKLFGVLGNGNPFITNPTRCDTWQSWGYGRAVQANTNVNSDPMLTGANDWVKTDPVDTAVDCSTLAPFTTTADAALTGTRGGNAGYTVDVNVPGLAVGDQGAATPKTITAVLPDAVNVDVQQLNRVCSNEQFAARACPANSKFGTVAITTPMITDGLHGDAYLVKRADGQNGLPDLGLVVSGAINFNVRGTNKYTGANFTQIQSTFDNIPAIGFSSFKLNIAAGSGSLLKIDECPSSGKTPADGGPTKFTITSWQGQTATFNSATSYVSSPCTNYTVKLRSTGKCVKRGKRFTVTPLLKSPKTVRYVKVSLTKSKTVKDKKRPFKLKVRTSKKLKKGKSYRYTVRAYFKPDAKYSKGRIVKKTGRVKICK